MTFEFLHGIMNSELRKSKQLNYYWKGLVIGMVFKDFEGSVEVFGMVVYFDKIEVDSRNLELFYKKVKVGEISGDYQLVHVCTTHHMNYIDVVFEIEKK